jgi:hypothetical protein
MANVEKLDLFDNAIDSLRHGLAHYIEYRNHSSISDIKQAIMNLVNAIDLLILERVRRKDEELIYQTEKTDRFGLGYRRTIHVDKAYQLIKEDVDEITDEEWNAYEILKILRNSATHSTFSFGDDKDSNIVFLLHYIARFLDYELGIDIEELLDEDEFTFYHNIIRDLDYGEVLQERVEAAIRDKIKWLNYRSIKNGGMPVVADWPCHECGKQGISLDEDLNPIGKCVFCGYQHRIGICDICEVHFDLDYEGFTCEEDGVTLCDFHSDLDNFD